MASATTDRLAARVGSSARPRRPALAPLLARAQLGRRALTLTTGLAAAVPVLAATVKAVREGWEPVADQGIISTRSWDVLTSHAPLVGQYSYAGHVTGKSTYSLGPMLYWLLALPAHYGSPGSITWTMAGANTLAIIGVVALARRRGGLVLMFAAAIALALMCQAVAAETLHDIWNPSAGLLPYTLLIFLCWSLACGEHRLLPLTALVASFMLQDNLMYLPGTVGLLAVGLGGLIVSRCWPAGRGRATVGEQGSETTAETAADRGSASDADGSPGAARAGRSAGPLWRWLLAALLVLALCWAAPVAQQLTEKPGNMTLVVQSATRSKQTLGATVGWRAVVRAVGVRPWWLSVPPDRWQRKYDVRVTPKAGAVVSCALLLVALFVAMAVGAWRGRRDVAAGALIGFVLCAALAAVAATTPTPRLLVVSLGYTLWQGSQVGMWVWLMLGWSGWLGLGWALRRFRSSPGIARKRDPVLASRLAQALACVAALAATGGVGAAVAASAKRDEHSAVYHATATLASGIERLVSPGHSVELEANLDYSTMVIKPGIRYLLSTHGVRALGPGSRARVGEWYELDHRPFQYVVFLRNGVRSPAKGAWLADRAGVVDNQGTHIVSAWVAAHP